jgi:O-antigen/teichoic acid export membrane protein
MPVMVDLYEQRNFPELDLLYRTVARWTSMIVIPAFGFLMLFRKQILEVFGRDYAGATAILVPLSVAWMIYYAKGPVDSLLDMTGRQIVDLANVAGVLVLSLGLEMWLIPRAGAVGAGWPSPLRFSRGPWPSWSKLGSSLRFLPSADTLLNRRASLRWRLG